MVVISINHTMPMKKIFTTLLGVAMATSAVAQWSPTTFAGEKVRPETKVRSFYNLDLDVLRAQLKNAQEAGKGATGVVVSLPTLDGKIEKFAVYSAPVVVKSLADKYQLGSYAGVGIDDPTKLVRFSIAPNDFQSMMFSDGKYEFIEPQDKAKSVYGVFPKTQKTEGSTFNCDGESLLTKQQLAKLAENSTFANNPKDFSKNSDQKFRTYRLAMSTTGEYTQFFGGVAQAFAGINATITRVNFVFEKDFAIRVILQDFPQLIFTDPNTDPYSPAAQGAGGAWNREVQNTLTTTIGNAAYDIGHLFGRSGGGGSAGDIGNVCRNAGGSNDNTSKGSAYTSPSSGNNPVGDTFDIDYVAHEMGHQFGAWHTFAHGIHSGSIAHMEPGSGSTIMGYAGITSSNVQMNSDPYFHAVSIFQVQNYVNTQSCDVNYSINNIPPVIAAMPDRTIPKGTAFVLTASATDVNNDPLIYTWEQYDGATAAVTNVTSNATQGPKFRSLTGSSSPTRYFPKQSMVLNGVLGSQTEWESVSNVARTMNFRVTVRDNHPIVEQQQTSVGSQKITVGTAGPFQITSSKIYSNSDAPFTWDVVGTTAAPYNVANVKIDYSLDNGATWNVLKDSTPNDGSENISFANLQVGATAHIRVSAIDNVFYAVKKYIVSKIVFCDGSSPVNVIVPTITSNSATVSWDAVNDATYILRYRKPGEPSWIEVPTSSTSVTINQLEEFTTYEYQVAAVCTGTVGTYTDVKEFTTAMLEYCSSASTDFGDEYISKVAVTAEGGSTMTSQSGGSYYSDYTADDSRKIILYANSTNNTIAVTKTWTDLTYTEGVTAWIDFNRNGTFEANEKIISNGPNSTPTVSSTFSVPANAYTGDKPVRMRVIMRYNQIHDNPCTGFTYGEVEDYAVYIPGTLGVADASHQNAIKVYPNPATDVVNISKVSDNAVYMVYSISGQLVSKGKGNKVQVSSLEKGVYSIVISDKGVTSTQKFIKK